MEPGKPMRCMIPFACPPEDLGAHEGPHSKDEETKPTKEQSLPLRH